MQKLSSRNTNIGIVIYQDLDSLDVAGLYLPYTSGDTSVVNAATKNTLLKRLRLDLYNLVKSIP